MIALALLLLVGATEATPAAAPAAIVIVTSRGTDAVPVAMDRGHPVLPISALERLLPIAANIEGDWAVVRFAEQPFRFLLGAPVFTFRGEAIPLAGGAYTRSDTLFVPLQWLTEHVPRVFSEAYRYDPLAAIFSETRLTPVVTRVSAPGAMRDSGPASGIPEAAAALGLRKHHKVVVDAGHGGRDTGTPGRYLPRGIQEKHVTLDIAKLVRQELEGRGIEVVMTRTRDVYVSPYARAPICRADCDLFVSIHVNAARRATARGVETYFFDQAKTAEAARVAQMENESLRYETTVTPDSDDALGFILKDLQRNEYLRESAQLADLIQTRSAGIHISGGRYVAQANFVVLRLATRPAVLVETGYGSNRQDGRFLASRDGKRRLSTAIADGIVDYLLRYETKTYSPSQ